MSYTRLSEQQASYNPSGVYCSENRRRQARWEICRRLLCTWCYMNNAVFMQMMSHSTQQSCQPEQSHISPVLTRFLFALAATIQILENVCELATLFFVIAISVCFCWIELLACLSCKIMIAHCIYEGSWKKGKHNLWDLMKNLRYVNEICHSVLTMCPLYSVLVLWMNYQISSFSSLTYPLWSFTCPNTRYTAGISWKKKRKERKH